MDRRKVQMVTLLIAVMVAFTLLPAGVSKLKIRQDELPISFDFSLEATPPTTHQENPRNVGRLLYTIVVIILLSSFLFLLITGGFRQLVGLGFIVAVLLLFQFLIQRKSPTVLTQRFDQPFGELGNKAPKPPTPPIEPDTWLIWAFAIVICLVVISIAFLIWRWAQKRISPMKAVAVEAKTSIEKIKEGLELKTVIIRCYHEMITILGKHHQLARPESMTPREFEAYLKQAGFLTKDVSQLSRLFEKTRYGQKTLGKAFENEAIQCLEAFARFCEVKNE